MKEIEQKFKIRYYYNFNPDKVIESDVLFGCYQLLGYMNSLNGHGHIICIITL